MTNLTDYLRDLAHEVRDETIKRLDEEHYSLTNEELEDIVQTYILAIGKNLIGGDSQ